MLTIASIAARIQREGEPAILRRQGQPDLQVHAFIRGYRADELVADIRQGDRQATISNQEIHAAGWPGPPRQNDKLLIRGVATNVASCETRMLRGAVAMHVLQVRGG